MKKSKRPEPMASRIVTLSPELLAHVSGGDDYTAKPSSDNDETPLRAQVPVGVASILTC